MSSETLRIAATPTTETSTLYFHQTNRTFGGTLWFGDPPKSGHVITISATKKNNFCTVTIDMFRDLGIYFNYHPSYEGPGHISIATLPIGYRPNTTVYGIGQSTTTNYTTVTSTSWGGFQIDVNGNIYQVVNDNAFELATPQLNIKHITGTINYTIDGTDYTADGIS